MNSNKSPNMPSLKEAFRAHPVYLRHPHLDFASITEVPESHVWPQFENCLETVSYSVDSDQSVSVPVIDLADPNNLAGNLIHACETWGVFHVRNHGIPLELLHTVELQARRLFELPMKQKLKAARAPDGVAGYGVARISSFFSKALWSEGFTIAGSSVEHARHLWPHDYFHFCDVMEEYESEMKKLTGKLIWLILDALGVTKEDIKWAGPAGEFPGSCACLQLNSYPACPSPDRVMGLPEHTDSSLLTILHQTNNISGLQVLREENNKAMWLTVPPLPGTLVVNVGDLLHILSNGRFRTVLHRAVANDNGHRLSVAYLWGPPPDARISSLAKLVGPDNRAMYRAISYLEYLSIKATHFNKALSFVRHPQPFSKPRKCE